MSFFKEVQYSIAELEKDIQQLVKLCEVSINKGMIDISLKHLAEKILVAQRHLLDKIFNYFLNCVYKTTGKIYFPISESRDGIKKELLRNDLEKFFHHPLFEIVNDVQSFSGKFGSILPSLRCVARQKHNTFLVIEINTIEEISEQDIENSENVTTTNKVGFVFKKVGEKEINWNVKDGYVWKEKVFFYQKRVIKRIDVIFEKKNIDLIELCKGGLKIAKYINFEFSKYI